MKNRYVTMAVMFGLLVVGATVLSTSDYPPPPNIRITTIPELNNEEQVFICPTDSNIIIANWRDFRLGYRQIGVGRSTDGGLTWSDSLINKPHMQHFGWDSKQSDPTMTVDRLGNFYMSALDYDGFGFSGLSTISFYKSTDKGLSWTGPVPAMWTGDPDIFEDKQFITVDRTGGPYDGNLFCSWTRFPNPDRIVFVRSINGGASFEDTVVVGPQQTSTGCGEYVIDAGQFSIPLVTSNGDVHVFWQGYALDSSENCTGTMTIKHVVSSDGGQSFSHEDTVLSVSGYTTADGGIATYSQPVADADITGGPFDGNAYITFTNTGPEDAGNGDVDFVRSTDNCVTWSERITINDDANSGAIDNFHPWLIVNQEGVIVVVFYDQRFDAPSYYRFDMLAAYSFDGGLTFTSNHRISEVSSAPYDLMSEPGDKPWQLDRNGLAAPVPAGTRAGLIGEYIGVSAFHDKINAVWTDSRDGNSEIYTANWYLPLLEPRLAGPTGGSIQEPTLLFEWSTSWKHNQDHYRLELSTSASFDENLVTWELDTNFYESPSQLADGTYYWRVKVFDNVSMDNSEYSEVWTFTVDETPPEQPVLLLPEDQSMTGNSTPLFDWTESAKRGTPVSYTLLVSTDPAVTAGPATHEYSGLDVSELVVPDPLADGVPTYWKVIAEDGAANSSTSATFTVTYVEFVCGDINGDGQEVIDISDLVWLVDYMFNEGPEPPQMLAADMNASGGIIDIADLVYLVDHMFNGGPGPVCL